MRRGRAASRHRAATVTIPALDRLPRGRYTLQIAGSADTARIDVA